MGDSTSTSGTPRAGLPRRLFKDSGASELPDTALNGAGHRHLHSRGTHQRHFRLTRTVQSFSESYKHTDLNELDRAFCELPPLGLLRIRYVRSHAEELVTDAGMLNLTKLRTARLLRPDASWKWGLASSEARAGLKQ